MITFAEFCAAKIRAAESDPIHPLTTLEDISASCELTPIGNAWTRAHYDGDFHLLPAAAADVPAVSLVFVQSREGNTGAENPADLGGGPTDTHLIYEGLSRVAADAVLAGAATAGGEDVFFSVWHPELVALRLELGLPRHPAQVVLTGTGCIDVARSRVFSVPDVPVFVIATPRACERLDADLRTRPWVRIVPLTGEDLRQPLRTLRVDHGLARISAIGGRTTATALLDQGLASDLCLTTTAKSAGEAETPFYAGKRPPTLTPIVTKRCKDPQSPFVFQHHLVR